MVGGGRRARLLKLELCRWLRCVFSWTISNENLKASKSFLRYFSLPNLNLLFSEVVPLNYNNSDRKGKNLEMLTVFTLHFRIKKLSTNSLRDFDSVLDTINHYWIDPAKYFCPKSSSLSIIYDSFKLKVLKMVKSRNGHHFYYISFS